MISEIDKRSKQEKRRWSRLPKFTEQWINMIKGSADFLGLNYYSSRYAESVNVPEGRNPSISSDQMMRLSVDSSWKRAKSDWLYSVPKGISDILRSSPVSLVCH